jgi:hypothetical protein
MESLPFELPTLDRNLRRTHFRFHIMRNPVEVIFRDKKYQASSSEITSMRKAQIAGYTDEVADILLNIALEVGDDDPRALDPRDIVSIDGSKYLIIQTVNDTGLNCYTLTLRKFNQ